MFHKKCFTKNVENVENFVENCEYMFEKKPYKPLIQTRFANIYPKTRVLKTFVKKRLLD